MKSLKKFSKLFLNYQSSNNWSPPEVWSESQVDHFESTAVDTYSFGVILWELETGNVPFESLDDKAMRFMLLEQKLRPQIPESTDKNL